MRISSKIQRLVCRRLLQSVNPTNTTFSAQKYKFYNKVREIVSGKIPLPPKEGAATTTHKRKPSTSQPSAQTPSKRLRTTPSVSRFHSYPDTTTPSTNRKLFSSANPTPTSIGPTPQRDGRVLGLFDLLSADEATPSRPRTGDFTANDAGGKSQPTTTPRKQTSTYDSPVKNPNSGDQDEYDPTTRHGRTPMSSSKRQMLDNFLYTPLKNKDNNIGGASFSARIGISPATRGATTPKGPGSVNKSLFATPAFLKRNSKPLDTVDENAESYLVSPRPLRLPRKPITRGLSSVVAGLRKLEEERLDEELDALREAEMEMEGVVPNTQHKGSVGRPAEAEVEVEDSQAPKLLGGFDDEALYDSPDDEQQLDRGQPLRVFKKKGQKRTTKRVNMRPTRTKRLEVPDDEGDEVVPETQATGDLPHADGELSESDHGDEEEDDDGAEKKKPGTKGSKIKGDGEKEGVVKKAVRKVKATAHANFKRLKLRSYGAKGGPGHGSRFKRRR